MKMSKWKTKLSSLNKLAAEQLVTVKAEVVQISGIKTIYSASHGKLKKQEVLIRDTTGCTKMVLWQEHVDTLQPKKMYEFKNLRLKCTKQERYLNTMKSEEFTAIECVPPAEPLVKVTPIRILGVRNAYKNLLCVSCNKKVRAKPNHDTLMVCQSCSLTQPLSTCACQWVLRLFVQNAEVPTTKLHLTIPQNLTEELMSNIVPTLKLSEPSEEDLIIRILTANKKINVTYDNISFQVTELEFPC